MRVLVATTAGSGHFGPMLPFARAAQDAGHEVRVASPASFAGAVQRAGFAHAPFADGDPAELGTVFASLPSMSWDEANATVMRDVFGRIDTTAALPGMRAIVREWRPDLILRESAEFSSYLVAEASDIPHVHIAIGLSSFTELAYPRAEEALIPLGAEPGLPNLFSWATLSLLPVSYDECGSLDEVRRYREDEQAALPAPLPEWWAGDAEPFVYVTFGSVVASLAPFADVYRGVVDALADVPVRVLLTTGEAGDPDALEPLPRNIHVERWWPQAQVMPHTSAMVGHGGFGTTLAGLVAGVPQVVMPFFADQPYNARRVAEVGAGIALHGGPAAIADLPAAVGRALGDKALREGAARIASEISALPTVSACLPFLESLA